MINIINSIPGDPEDVLDKDGRDTGRECLRFLVVVDDEYANADGETADPAHFHCRGIAPKRPLKTKTEQDSQNPFKNYMSISEKKKKKIKNNQATINSSITTILTKQPNKILTRLYCNIRFFLKFSKSCNF